MCAMLYVLCPRNKWENSYLSVTVHYVVSEDSINTYSRYWYCIGSIGEVWCDGAADLRPAAAEARQPPGPVQVPAAELRQAPPGRRGLLQSLRQVGRTLYLLELETNFREDQWCSSRYPFSGRSTSSTARRTTRSGCSRSWRGQSGTRSGSSTSTRSSD